jgi:serine/threonine protein kinase
MAPTEQLIYRNDRTAVYRCPATLSSVAVIRKQALGAGARARIQHELSILGRLADLDGVPRPVPSCQGDSLLLEDVGGRSLADLLADGPFDVAALAALGARLALTLSGIHQAGVIHKDINPSNIVVVGPPLRPMVVDFDLATTFAQVRPAFADPADTLGRLPYMAPEQTGRTALSVDYRADLYSLGATLYHLATGAPPFQEPDPLRLVRDVLVGVPAPLSVRVPGVSPALSDIVARLLEKEPDRRYQSAEGLAFDLGRLAASVQSGAPDGPEAPLELGIRDFPIRLSAPSRLIGRDRELGQLRSALDDAAEGRARALLVSGGPGVGKSALTDQLRTMAVDRGGWFVTGKADQYRSDAASNVVTQALGGVARLLLAEPPSGWRVSGGGSSRNSAPTPDSPRRSLPSSDSSWGRCRRSLPTTRCSSRAGCAELRPISCERSPRPTGRSSCCWTTSSGRGRWHCGCWTPY